ncbi:MAG: nuclear export factor [Mucilaginibacter sp.]|nr:nuclear export factor [Mucilaginibacter sp.]
MNTSAARGGAKRGRGSTGRTPTGRSAVSGRTQTRDRNIDAIQKAISNSQDSFSIRSGKNTNADRLEQYSVRGWKNSKISSRRDRGVESLVAFLERRMNTLKSGSRAKITKVCHDIRDRGHHIYKPRHAPGSTSALRSNMTFLERRPALPPGILCVSWL